MADKAPKNIEETTEKMVKIKIPRDRNNDSDVFVSVNMRTWQIQRGVEVEVPECVAEVLQHREDMLDVAYRYNAKASSD